MCGLSEQERGHMSCWCALCKRERPLYKKDINKKVSERGLNHFTDDKMAFAHIQGCFV